MAKQKNETFGDVSYANNKLRELNSSKINQSVNNFDCSGNYFKHLAWAPNEIRGDFICKNNKDESNKPNPLNQFHLGAGRFEMYGGKEDEDINRPVKVGGTFNTDTQIYKKPKIYDVRVGAPKKTQSESSTSTNPKVIQLENSVKLVVGIKKPILAFDLTGTPEFNNRGEWGYGRWKPNSDIHGFFTPRQKFQGGFDEYAGVHDVPKDGWKGWGQPPFNFKNFINWSYFEAGNGRGALCESQYTWGSYQPNGATILNGKMYGSKSSENCRGQHTYTYYYLKNDPTMYRELSINVWKGKPGKTVEYVSKHENLHNIAVAVSAASVIIKNNKVAVGDTYGTKKHPFFGKLNDGTYFAGNGAAPRSYAQTLINYFTKKGKRIEWADIGDGGGSTTLGVDGKLETGGGRPLAVVIGWNE